ncbi:lipopolysaccharide biosynthesis protein [Parafrankia sp. FMc2]|uniref:lipopolysaccharide biosynthesis protein n=1 Tax=Parafrankia sp. FMc2 TaxID=3233196 RepID=UPI0034D6AFB8
MSAPTSTTGSPMSSGTFPVIGTEAAAGGALYRNGAALALSGLISALLGAGFWIAAAHTTPRAAVGEATALVSAMMALSMLGQLNLGPALAAFLPRAGRRRVALVAGGTATAAVLSLLLGAGFVLAAPRVSDAFHTLERPFPAVGFVLAVGIWSVFALQDAALTGMRCATWVPVKNTAYSAAKFGLLLVIGGTAGALLAAWIIPAAIVVVPVAYLLFTRVLPTRDDPAPGVDSRAFRRFLAGESTAMVLDQIGVTLLPVLVVALVGPAAAAPFGLVWMIVQALDAMVVALGSSLVVEGSHAEADVTSMHRALRRRTLAGLGVITAIAALGAPVLLRVFGTQYAHEGADVLRLLLLGSLGRAVVTLAICAARARLRIGWIVRMHLLLAVLVPGSALVLGDRAGLTGIGLAWAGAQCLAAAIVLAGERPGRRSLLSRPLPAPGTLQGEHL